MYKLLVVDDERDIRKGIVESNDWEDWGFSVIGEADDGSAAIDMIKKYEPAVVLSDIRMPGIDGVELMQWVRENRPDIMMVVLSGYSDFSYLTMSIKNNVAAYILKPTNLSEFEKTFREIAEKLKNREAESFEKKKSEKSLHEGTSAMRSSFFSQLLSGQIKKETHIQEELDRIMVKSTPDGGRVVVVSIHRTSEYYLKVERSEKLKIKEGIVSCLNEGIDSWRRNKKGFFFLNSQEIISGLVKAEDDFLKQFFTWKKREIFQRLGIMVHIGTSAPVSFWSELPEKYAEARNSLYQGNNESFYEKNTSRFFNSFEEIQVEWPGEKLLSSAFLERNKEKMRKLEGDFFRSLSSVAFMDFGRLDFILMKYIHLLSFAAEKAGIDFEKVLENINVKAEDLYSVESFAGKRFFISYIADGLERTFSERRFPGPKERLSGQIIECIENEFCSPVFSLNMVSEKVKKSPAYVSKVFKETTGKNFLEYVRDLRIQKAVHLLKTSQLKVYEIADAIGYADPTTFFRTFKAYTGASPADFQRKGGENEKDFLLENSQGFRE